jgi:hypothetical protein
MLLFYKNKTRKSYDFIDEYIVGDFNKYNENNVEDLYKNGV